MKVYRVGDFVNVEEISTSPVVKIDVDDVTVIDWGTGSDKLGIHSNLTQITYTDEYQNIVDQAGNVLGSTKEEVRLALVALTSQTGGAVVNDTLTSTSTTEALSANQGRALKGLIDTINALLSSDRTDLDSLQEVVDFIEANRDDLNKLQAKLDQGLPSVVASGSGDLTAVKGWNDQVLSSLIQSSHNLFSINSDGNLSIPGAGLYLVGMTLVTSNMPTGVGIKYILNAGGITVNRGFTHADATSGFWGVSGIGIAIRTNNSPIGFRFFFDNTTQLIRSQGQYFCIKLS